MRARVAKQDILSAVMHTFNIADKKSVVPILSYVLLNFDEKGLTLKATDLDQSLIETVAADVDTFGTVTVPAGTFSDIVRKLPDDATLEFSFADKGEKLLLTAGKSKFELSTLDPSDFPEIALLNNSCNFKLKAADLNRLISRTKFSMSPEENRHNLNGIYLHKEDERLEAASTDGHRLSVSSIPLASKESIQGVIISKKTVLELKKLLDSDYEDVSLTFTANQVQFAIGNITFISKLVDGTFPDYKRVIPQKEDSGSFVVKRTDFSEIIDRVIVMSDEKVRPVKLELGPNTLSCYVANSKLGSGKDEVDVEYEGQAWSAGFNSSYLLDVAQTLEGEKLRIYIRESLSPILIEDESESESLFVVMPMRI